MLVLALARRGNGSRGARGETPRVPRKRVTPWKGKGKGCAMDRDVFLSAPLAFVSQRDNPRPANPGHWGEPTVVHLMHRLREVRSKPAGKRNGPEERKLISHSVLITVSVILTVTCTGTMFVIFHMGLTIPILPGYLQEVWDWVWRQ